MDIFGQILAERGGHFIVDDTTAYGATDYHFWGFIPTEDTVLAALQVGTQSVVQTSKTYKAGIYYAAPYIENKGYYNAITLTSGAVVLILTKNSPTKY